MPSRPCPVCGRLTVNGSRCPDHARKPSPSTRATHRPGWAKLRAAALKRDRYRCARCGATDDVAVHHRIHAAQEGPNALYNLVTLCAGCHHDAHREPPAA